METYRQEEAMGDLILEGVRAIEDQDYKDLAAASWMQLCYSIVGSDRSDEAITAIVEELGFASATLLEVLKERE